MARFPGVRLDLLIAVLSLGVGYFGGSPLMFILGGVLVVVIVAAFVRAR